MRLRNLEEKLEECAKRGSMKAICHNLEKASEQGLFKAKTVLRDFLTTISKNLHVKKQGKRYKASTKFFFEVVLIWGGPRLATFVAQICLDLKYTLSIGGAIVTALHWKVE